MNIYYKNQKAVLYDCTPTVDGSSVNNIYDTMLELRADFAGAGSVTVKGRYDNNRIVAADALCLGCTNAHWYKLTTREGTWEGRIAGRITIHDFDETKYIDGFNLELGFNDDVDVVPVFLGYLYLGKRTELPRFAVAPNTEIELTGEGTRSFGGQLIGMKRITLDSFAVKFNRITSEEHRVIKEYIEAVQNIVPHIIDPYAGARDKFPPMYAALDIKKSSWAKLNEDGFYYGGSLAWKEAK